MDEMPEHVDISDDEATYRSDSSGDNLSGESDDYGSLASERQNRLRGTHGGQQQSQSNF